MDRFCRGCLVRFEEPTELLQYTEKNRRLFVYSTGIQVKRNDPLTFQLCKDCYLNMKAACNFKKQCRTSDKRFKSYLGLKENEESVDLCTFLKNNDDSWAFRFPGNSTPAYQRAKDDDNESTTTSIRNFMMDIMPDDDLPDTEARIIKEVIDEEADVLEDSLDSHWLQDDASIDTDFRLDFSFSPFSTPRPVDDDRYTPKKPTVAKTVNKTNESKQINTATKKILHNLDMPLIDDESNHSLIPATMERHESDHALISIKELKKDNKDDYPLIPITQERDLESNRTLVPIKEERNFDETMDSLDVVNEFLNYESENANQIDVEQTQSSTREKLEEALGNIDVVSEPVAQCTIDRNLEEALKNTDDKDFLLDELLVSPKVTSGIQSPPTPLINNILFGDKLDMDENSNSSQKFKSGQCIETYENVIGDVEMTEEFSTAIDIKIEFDLDELKTELIDEIDRQANQEAYQANNECRMCQKKFKSLKKLEQHFRRHQLLEELNTEFIDEKTSQEKNRFDVTNFYCNMCQKKFKNLKSFQTHAKRHQTTNEQRRKWICDYCARECNDRTNFVRHLLTHARPPKPKYQCEMCKIEFNTLNTYKQHTRAHKGEEQVLKPAKKRFVCTECGVSMDKASNFKIHVQRHQKNYTHTCPECNKGFVRQADLTVHMRLHTGEKPFECPHCDMRFARRDVLTGHIKCHLDLRPFKCGYCNSRYVNSTNLRNHYKKSARCRMARQKIATDQKKSDENSITKTFVTEELLVSVAEKSAEGCSKRYKRSTSKKGREKIATDQKKTDEKNSITKTYVTEELSARDQEKSAEDCSPG